MTFLSKNHRIESTALNSFELRYGELLAGVVLGILIAVAVLG